MGELDDYAWFVHFSARAGPPVAQMVKAQLIQSRVIYQGTRGGKVMASKRSAANKQAATRSALVPGLTTVPLGSQPGVKSRTAGGISR